MSRFLFRFTSPLTSPLTSRVMCGVMCGVIYGALMSACGGGEAHKRKEQARYHAELAYGYLVESQDPNAALQEVLKSLALHDENAEAHNIAGLVFMGRQDWLKALKHAKRALELKPDFHNARNNLGVTYLTLGQWSEAVKVFEVLTTTLEYRTPARAYNNLGWALFKLNRLDEAQRAFTSATKLNPRLCPPHNNLGLVALKLNALDLAERALTRAYTQCPTYAEPHLHLAQLYTRQGAQGEAVSALQRCVALGGDSDIGLRCALALKRGGYEVAPPPAAPQELPSAPLSPPL